MRHTLLLPVKSSPPPPSTSLSRPTRDAADVNKSTAPRSISPLAAAASSSNPDPGVEGERFQQNRPVHSRRDVVVLLTTTNFNEGASSMAIPASICTPRATAVLKV
ncbi:unnamed protein product [Dibothriocephalus latus]|uniref:Uncharacterized protein n=1 Tax=Dibothriocephalus latus TaxID=60516 RepID=A0A3P7M3X0_DIBLA|nr:unnamed protein product [Dibothriocephalus latus]